MLRTWGWDHLYLKPQFYTKYEGNKSALVLLESSIKVEKNVQWSRFVIWLVAKCIKLAISHENILICSIATALKPWNIKFEKFVFWCDSLNKE